MQHTRKDAHCPMCGSRVGRTHRCTGRPAPLVPMPSTFREALDVALADVRPELEQLDLLDVLDRGLAPTLLARADAHRDRRRPRPWS